MVPMILLLKIPKILREYPVQVGQFYGTIFRDDLDRTVSIMKFALASEYVESSSVFFGYDYWGKALPLLRQYWAGGYMAYLPKEEKSTATSTLSSLKESKWLEKGTRILLVGKSKEIDKGDPGSLIG